MTRRGDGWIDSGAVAKRLGIARLTVVKMGEDGRLPPPTRFTTTGHRYWRAEEIARVAVAGSLPVPKRATETSRRPSPASLSRQYAIRCHFVEVAGQIRMEDLAEAFEVSRAQAYGAVRGRKLGGSRYDRLRDDGLQPAIDRLWAQRRPRRFSLREPDDARQHAVGASR